MEVCWEAKVSNYPRCGGYPSAGYTCAAGYCAAMDPEGNPAACAIKKPNGWVVDSATGQCKVPSGCAAKPLTSLTCCKAPDPEVVARINAFSKMLNQLKDVKAYTEVLEMDSDAENPEETFLKEGDLGSAGTQDDSARQTGHARRRRHTTRRRRHVTRRRRQTTRRRRHSARRRKHVTRRRRHTTRRRRHTTHRRRHATRRRRHAARRRKHVTRRRRHTTRRRRHTTRRRRYATRRRRHATQAQEKERAQKKEQAQKRKALYFDSLSSRMRQAVDRVMHEAVADLRFEMAMPACAEDATQL